MEIGLGQSNANGEDSVGIDSPATGKISSTGRSLFVNDKWAARGCSHGKGGKQQTEKQHLVTTEKLLRDGDFPADPSPRGHEGSILHPAPIQQCAGKAGEFIECHCDVVLCRKWGEVPRTNLL